MRIDDLKKVIAKLIRENFHQSLSEGIPKLFLKIEAVKNAINRLTAERKSKFGGEYARKLNAETDPKKREQLKEPILAISKKITAFQKNLLKLYDMEEIYIQNLDKDVELNLSEMSKNDVHFKEIMKMYDRGGSFTKKKVAVIVCRNSKASRRDIEEELLDTTYEDIVQYQDELNIKESVEGDRIQKLNDRIKALRDKMNSTKSSTQKNLIQQRLKNALQTLTKIKSGLGIKKINTESVKEGIWPKSKLASIFQIHLAAELKKNFKGIFYGVGNDIYYNDKKVLTVDGDRDNINTIVAKLKKIIR